MQLKTILNKFKQSNPIIVIGDPIRDRYIFTEAERISPEAPVLILKKIKVEDREGGALNVCNNIQDLKGKVVFLCQKAYSLKTRIIASNQQLLRIDEDYIVKLSKTEANQILSDIKWMYQNTKSRIIILSDYAKGNISKELFMKIINLSKKYMGLKIIIDPNIKHKSWYKSLKGLKNIIMVPNLKEYNAGCKGSEILVLTKGENGMEIIIANRSKYLIPATKLQVSDVTGAGDTVVAVLGLCLNIGLNLNKSTQIANKAASIVVSKFGTSTIKPKELKNLIKAGYL